MIPKVALTYIFTS